ncbi:phospholipid carrier-dependent glycosyltransferase [Blastopirellula sp. JC732]|uniref:Phospholipid carrier-dependent glycosyltransferase n=1 Tax=Blastopirellula sediminis TaxID=2894196 RepID=A0A9X1MSX5_9BACT|nr:phospholipid carrier-dependent glycosyltransferase [Blastopirellula sediminis]MCC9604796.1 phospholipid carrier-dependent glycosyltransferase [Blastopirellula sediminis]MCC9631905.1 phospholipid carrier-dependent glycosyltransferase [Blastopirellula sediminis]
MSKLFASRWFWVILLLAFALRVGAAYWWQSRIPAGERFFFGDSASYETLARQVAHGEDYRYGDSYIFRTPGYPAILAPFYWFSDEPNPMTLRIFGAALGTITAALCGILAARFSSTTAGLIATLLAAFYPGGLAMSAFVLSEVAFCPWMLLQIWFWDEAFQSDSRRSRLLWAIAAGVMMAAAVLTRPSWMLFPFFAVPICLLMLPQRLRQIEVMFVLGLSFMAAMSPWWIRNYQVAGRFVPTSLQVGASLYDGIRPGADGGSDMAFVEPFRQEQLAADAAAEGPLLGTFETRLDDRMKAASVAWAKEHPGEVVELAGKKLIRYWNFWPNESSFQSVKFRLIIAVGYLPILILGLVGLVAYRRQSLGIWLCGLPIFYFSLLHMIFVSSIRYRQPPMIPLTVLAAGAAVWLFYRWRSAKEPSTETASAA